VDLSFDPATKLMTSASVMKDGVAQTTTVYGDYARTNGVMLPRTVQQRFAGQLREDLRLGATQFGEAPMQRFIAPAGYVTAPAAGVPTARALAPGAWIFENMPGGYRSMVVDAGDHLVVLEAPLSPAYAGIQKRLIGEIAPGKSVRYVVVTHHHGDHTGGLKTWVEVGVTLLAPKGAAVALRRQLVGRGLTRPVSIEEVDERRTLGSGTGRVDLHAFSTSHARAHLLAYVPDRGGPPPAFRVVGDLFEQIRRRRLAVETVVGVHGRPATLAEAERSLERGRREGWGL
jgi:glyoxylase-like metal-dependent hydrolase (beta-lactamase superfamily II)